MKIEKYSNVYQLCNALDTGVIYGGGGGFRKESPLVKILDKFGGA